MGSKHLFETVYIITDENQVLYKNETEPEDMDRLTDEQVHHHTSEGGECAVPGVGVRMHAETRPVDDTISQHLGIDNIINKHKIKMEPTEGEASNSGITNTDTSMVLTSGLSAGISNIISQSKMKTSQRRKCTFNEVLQKEFKCIKLDNSYSDKTRVVCEHCKAHFSVAHGGKSDIKQHLRSQKHKSAQNNLSPEASNNSCSDDGDDESYKIAACEALFAFHTIHHNQSFRAYDCLSKLIKKIYQPRFSSARTKSEAIITNVLSPYILNEVILDLDKIRSITICLDTSNKNELKLLPIVVRYFLPNTGVQVKILDFMPLADKVSNTHSDILKNVIEKLCLKDKIVGLFANSINTNFSGCKSVDKNNAWRKMANLLERDIIVIGCSAHIIQNCLQCAIDCLPIDTECFVLKVYTYFYVYTVTVEELKEFCDCVGNNYTKLLEHGNTRFLSLGTSLEQILNVFDSLRSYFLSQDKCPVILKKEFENPILKLWLMFARDQIITFQRYINYAEKDDITATEAAVHIENLQNALETRRKQLIVTGETVQQLKNFVEADEIHEGKFFDVVKNFYGTSIEYLNKCKCSLGNTDKFEWILLRKVPEWKDIQNSISEFKEHIITRMGLDENCILEQWMPIKQIIMRQFHVWNRENIPVSERWVQIFTEMHEKCLHFQDFNTIVEFVLCLPGNIGPVERIFSIMNLRPNVKSRLNTENLKAILMLKQNCDLECDMFYNKILNDQHLLNKIKSSEKYWRRINETQQHPSTST